MKRQILDAFTQEHFEQCKELIRKQLIRILNSPLQAHFQNLKLIKDVAEMDNFSYQTFSELVPYFSKQLYFGSTIKTDYWLSSAPKNYARYINLSAGTSGTTLSFRIGAEKDLYRIQRLASNLLPQLGVHSLENSIFINAYPMGVSLPPELNQMTLPGRADLLAPALRLVSSQFEKQIIIAQPHLLFSAIHNQILSPSLLGNSIFILGGGHVSPAYWTWLNSQLTISGGQSLKGVNLYGLAETGLGVGYTFGNTTSNNNQQSQAVKLHLDGDSYFFESIDGELVITSLDPETSIPLVRYRTGDRFTLEEFILPTSSSPTLRIGSNTGRKSKLTNEIYTAEAIENTFYKYANLLPMLTGDFHLESNSVCFETKTTLSAIQKAEAASIIAEDLNQNSFEIHFTEKLNRYPVGLCDLHRKPYRE